MREDHRDAGGHAPARRELALDADVDQMIQVVDLSPAEFALLLFYGADKVPEGLLIAIAKRESPQLRTRVFLDSAGRSGEHTKPGCGCTCGDSTLSRSGPRKARYEQDDPREQGDWTQDHLGQTTLINLKQP